MKTITICYFKERYQSRITFVKALKEYDNNLGLKEAKDLLDAMLDGKPIEYAIDDKKLQEFVKKLNRLKLHFTIK